MRLNFMLHGGREPAIRLLSIQKANFAVPCLPVSSRTPKLTARGKHLLNIASRLHLSLKEHVLLSCCRDTNMVCACSKLQRPHPHPAQNPPLPLAQVFLEPRQRNIAGISPPGQAEPFPPWRGQ